MHTIRNTLMMTVFTFVTLACLLQFGNFNSSWSLNENNGNITELLMIGDRLHN